MSWGYDFNRRYDLAQLVGQLRGCLTNIERFTKEGITDWVLEETQRGLMAIAQDEAKQRSASAQREARKHAMRLYIRDEEGEINRCRHGHDRSECYQCEQDREAILEDRRERSREDAA